METRDKEEIRRAVRESYGKVAKLGTLAPGLSLAATCCGESVTPPPEQALRHAAAANQTFPQNRGLGTWDIQKRMCTAPLKARTWVLVAGTP